MFSGSVVDTGLKLHQVQRARQTELGPAGAQLQEVLAAQEQTKLLMAEKYGHQRRQVL